MTFFSAAAIVLMGVLAIPLESFSVDCVRNSDCLQGLICSANRCIAECREDLDCPLQGLNTRCTKTMSSNIPEAIGGGIFANRCLPRKSDQLKEMIAAIPVLAKIHPEITGVEALGDAFWTFVNLTGDPQVCAKECEKNRTRCRAWVMHKAPNPDAFARCTLKSGPGGSLGNGDTISGFLE